MICSHPDSHPNFLSLTYPLIHTQVSSVSNLPSWFTPTLLHTQISSVSGLPLDSHPDLFSLTYPLIHPPPPPRFPPKYLLSLIYPLTYTHPDSHPPWFTSTLIHTHPDSHPPWFTSTLIHTHLDSRPPWFTPTFFLSPGNQLRVLLSLLSFDAHELLELAVMVNDSDQLLHLRVVLLHVLVGLLLQDNHLGLGVIPGNRATNLCQPLPAFLLFIALYQQHPTVQFFFGTACNPSIRQSIQSSTNLAIRHHPLWTTHLSHLFTCLYLCV